MRPLWSDNFTANRSSGERASFRFPSRLVSTRPTSPFLSSPNPARAFPLASNKRNSSAFTPLIFCALTGEGTSHHPLTAPPMRLPTNVTTTRNLKCHRLTMHPFCNAQGYRPCCCLTSISRRDYAQGPHSSLALGDSCMRYKKGLGSACLSSPPLLTRDAPHLTFHVLFGAGDGI